MATPSNTIQIGKAQPNTGAATGGKIPFGITDQGGADEKFIAFTIYSRAGVAISTGQVFNLTSLETSVGAQEKTAMDPAGQTANKTFHDEFIELQIQGHPMGSSLDATANAGALLGAYLPPPGAYVKLSNAPALKMGFVDGSETLLTGDKAVGDALNSTNWQVQIGAKETLPGDASWGVTFTVRRHKSPAMGSGIAYT